MRRVLYRPNSTVLRCRLNAPNCISSRRSAGKLFHTRGPATEKLLSPKVLWVRGRKHVLWSEWSDFNSSGTVVLVAQPYSYWCHRGVRRRDFFQLRVALSLSHFIISLPMTPIRLLLQLNFKAITVPVAVTYWSSLFFAIAQTTLNKSFFTKIRY